MYDFIRGKVAARQDGTVVLESAGIGYRFVASASTARGLPPGSEATLYAHVVMRDDRLEMFGFASLAERHLFLQLLQVSGVGPAVALGLLSAHEPAALATHIASGDVARLTKVKGIGKRTAERILVELRDKFAASRTNGDLRPVGTAREDAVLALCSLGLPRNEAERRVLAVGDEDLSTEDYVKHALR
ncbi:MAG: Holliday junction branch migration protein RuvA [Planctomycetota bacterium]